MAGKIQEELKQNQPLPLDGEAFLNLVRTASQLMHETGELLRQHDLTHTQYNVLRILRGAGKGGLTSTDIGSRMITREPDVTRLLDRLEARGLVERGRCTEDRRVVWTRITAEGLRRVGELDAPARALHEAQFRHMAEDRLRLLVDLLEEVRSRE